jgi:glutathione synthase/RimK-type ligase-like ATP-grasp enzyme
VPRLALVTAVAARHLDTDLPLLTSALAAHPLDVELAAWDDATVDWSRFDAAVVRSTWDYHRRLDDFIAWIRTTDTATRLWNPAEVMIGNLDKRYLADLAADGIPIVPSRFLVTADDIGRAVREGAFDGDVVVKPSVGAGANGARRFVRRPLEASAHATVLLAGPGCPMVQPYVGGVDEWEETGIVTLGGRVSHAFAKGAILSADPEWAEGLYVTERIGPRTPTVAELDLAEAVLAVLPDTAYARIDLLPGDDGPLVSEVELVEPSLFLHVAEGAPATAAAALARLVSG